MSRITPEQAIAPKWVVYRLLGERSEPLYVGMTGNLQSRLQQHSKRDYWRLTKSVEVEEFSDRDGAAMRESDLIYELDPPFNLSGRRTREGETAAAGAHGPATPCPDCTALGLIRYGGDLIDAQTVFKDGTAFGNVNWIHRCPARRLIAR